MNYDYDKPTPYKKKSKRKPPAKANHKHDFRPCLFEFDGIFFDKIHGFVSYPEVGCGTYCIICGKIGRVSFTEPESKDTLPRFRVDDIWSQKFVPIYDG